MYDENDIESILAEYKSIVYSISLSAYYSSATIELADLRQVGNVAVLQAIKSYNPSGGTNIKSYVARVVRNAIYHEAARFLGVFTVDHRVTGLASKASKLHDKGHSDEEIAEILNNTSSRNFDWRHVRDLRVAYNCGQESVTLDDQDSLEEGIGLEEQTIHEVLERAVQSPTDRTILDMRILDDYSVQDVSEKLSITQRNVYELENALKERIKRAIEEITD